MSRLVVGGGWCEAKVQSSKSRKSSVCTVDRYQKSSGSRRSPPTRQKVRPLQQRSNVNGNHCNPLSGNSAHCAERQESTVGYQYQLSRAASDEHCGIHKNGSDNLRVNITSQTAMMKASAQENLRPPVLDLHWCLTSQVNGKASSAIIMPPKNSTCIKALSKEASVALL